jgi:hypothetical protein
MRPDDEAEDSMASTSAETALERSKEYLRVYGMLIRTAQQGGFVTYKDVADVMGVSGDPKQITRKTGQMLRLIVDREHRSGRPVLSSVVVSESNHQPVASFYSLASSLKLLPPDATKEQRTEFWRKELKRVFEEWAD